MKKIIITMLISIFICILILFIKNQYSYLLLRNANYGMPALIKKEKVNNLFLGSSTFRQGIDSKQLDSDDYVLSYNGAQPVLEYWILNKIIKDGVKINNLYIDLYPYTLYSEPSISDTKIFIETNIKEKFELYDIIDKKDYSTIWDMFIASNNEILLTWPIYYHTINQTFKNGGSTLKTTGITNKKMDNLEMVKRNSDLNNDQRKAIQKIVNLCKKNNINLTFIEIPKALRIHNNKSYNDMINNYLAILNELNVNYILSDNINSNIKNDSKNYTDLIHLSTKGKIEFTKELKKILE